MIEGTGKSVRMSYVHCADNERECETGFNFQGKEDGKSGFIDTAKKGNHEVSLMMDMRSRTSKKGLGGKIWQVKNIIDWQWIHLVLVSAVLCAAISRADV